MLHFVHPPINFNKKGFALVQVLLAIALGVIIATSVVYYYTHVSSTETYHQVASNIIQSAELSQQETAIGQISNKTITVNSYKINIANGQATLSSIDKTACSSISSELKGKGQVQASCNSTTEQNNSIVFNPVDTFLGVSSKVNFSAGTPDNNTNSTVTDAVLNGKLAVSGANVATKSTSSVFTSNGTTLPNTESLKNGNDKGLASGVAKNPITTSAPTSTKGNTALACSYYLKQPEYQTSSLGTRSTPCESGYASTSNQTGVRTWACPVASSSALPVSTDTWTGGSCAPICVPASPEYRTVACPTGEYGSETQEATSSCPAYTGNPIYGSWITVSTANCHPNCSAPATTQTSNYQWVTINVGCPAGYTGNNTYQAQQVQTITTSWSCPSVSSSPVSNTSASGWSNTGATQNVNNNCTLSGPPVPLFNDLLTVTEERPDFNGMVQNDYTDLYPFSTCTQYFTSAYCTNLYNQVNAVMVANAGVTVSGNCNQVNISGPQEPLWGVYDKIGYCTLQGGVSGGALGSLSYYGISNDATMTNVINSLNGTDPQSVRIYVYYQ
jgi:hypothetical protein